MNSKALIDDAGLKERQARPFDGDMAELTLLLPGWEARRLEAAAHRRGLTTAQMLRRLIRNCTAADDRW